MASALLTAGLTAGTATAQPSLSASYDFKTLDFPGSFFSFPLGINNHREIAGSYEDGSGNHGYRWKNGKFTIIDFPGAMQFPSSGSTTPFFFGGTAAGGINDRGDIAGTYTDRNGFQHGYVLAKPAWCGGEDDDPDEGCKAVFTQIDVPGAAQTVGILFEFGPGLGTAAIGINNSGSVVGMYATHGQYSNGFRLSHGVFSDVSDPLAGHSPGEGSKCFAINGNGAMACDYITNGITHGFLVDEGKRIPIEAPNQAFFGTQITGVNSSEVVVGVFGSPIGLQGLVWIAGHYSTLGFPAKPYNELHSINDRGDITGAYANNPDGSDGHGFVAFPKER